MYTKARTKKQFLNSYMKSDAEESNADAVTGLSKQEGRFFFLFSGQTSNKSAVIDVGSVKEEDLRGRRVTLAPED